MSTIPKLKLPEYRPAPEPRDYHLTGDCKCPRPYRSGSFYGKGWGAHVERCLKCGRLIGR